jgi:predicted ATPase/transcriptional regulator with XRE-family HTH domain
MIDRLTFGTWLKDRRKELDLTQLDLADSVGCSEDTIQKIERGERRPSKQVAELLADYFQIPAEQREVFLQFARGHADEGQSVPGSSTSSAHDRPLEAPAPRVQNPNNLPVQLTSFVGRAIEVPRIRDMMLTPEVRLLTLTGPPGTGKTRLALQVAAQQLDEFEDGVFFVSLAPIGDPALVISEIAQSLGVTIVGTPSLLEAVESYLSARNMLLVLDNFEQVAEAAPTVADLLTKAPGLKVMVTSRVPLHIRGEKEYSVPPLQLPNTQDLPPLDRLSRYEAINLFTQRAKDVRADFELTGDNASAVAQICSRLDGLPLALELAAARVKLLSPQAILARLEGRLALLTGGPRDLPARQRTLRGAIEWSHDLLDDEEKKLFRRLGVFVGGFTLEAADAICSYEPASTSSYPGILEGIASLVDKSLVQQREGVGAEPQFTMLETILAYSRDKLAESGEEEETRRRHALYFVGLAEEANLKVWGPTEESSLDRFDEEHDNLRAAIQWSHSRVDGLEIELRLVGALGRFWEFRSYSVEGRQRIASALSRPESRQPEVKLLRAWALLQAATLAYWHTDYSAAQSAAEEALRTFTELGNKQGIAVALTDLSDIFRSLGDYDKALGLGLQALEISRGLADPLGTLVSLIMVGWAEIRPGYYDQAAVHIEEALSIGRQLDAPNRTAFALAGLAEVKLRQGDYESADNLLEEALALHRATGFRWGIAATLGTIAWIALRRKDYRRSRGMLAESLAMRNELSDKGGIAWCLERFADIEIATADLLTAAHLLGAASSVREATGAVVDIPDQAEYDRTIELLRSRFGEEAFGRAYQEGRAMSMEQAMEYALSLHPPTDH